MARRKKQEDPRCETCGLRQDSVFCDLPHSQVENISYKKSCIHAKRGDIIYDEGSVPKGLYCIHAGNFKVYQRGPDGKDQILKLCKPGDVLGYRALLGGGQHVNTVEAIDQAVICFVPRVQFMEVINGHAPFPMRMMQLLSTDLKDAERRLTYWTQRPVRERLAETLLLLQESYGQNEEGHINITLRREDLANVIGTATETLIRALNDLKREELIHVERKKIAVLDERRLLHLANVH